MNSQEIDFPRSSGHVPKTETVESRQQTLSVNKTESNKTVRVEILGFNMLSVGWVLLGKIKRIETRDIVVALPNRLVGYIPIRDISDNLTRRLTAGEHVEWEQWFHKNDLVVVQITKLERARGSGHNKIGLTCRPAVINSELGFEDLFVGLALVLEVASEEDIGYILKCSDNLDKLFLLPKHKTIKLEVGQLVRTKITQIRNMVVEVGPSLQDSETRKVSMDNMFPGMLADCRIVKIVNDRGLLVSFFGKFQGVVDLLNLPQAWVRDTNLSNMYSTVDAQEKTSRFVGRIIYMDRAGKAIGLTTLDMDNSEDEHYRVGQFVHHPQILRSISNYGVLFELEHEMVGFAHTSRFGSETEKARIIDIGFGRLVYLSFDCQAIEQDCFGCDTIRSGDLVKAKVVSIRPFGAVVEIADNIRAVCPAFHWTEDCGAGQTIQVDPRNFRATYCPFSRGQRYQFRVLSVDAKARRIMVTFKHTLVSSTLPILTNLRDAAKPEYSAGFHGYVIAIRNRGVVIGFCNNIRGYLPMSQIAIEEIRPGQAILVRSIRCDPDNHRLLLSADMQDLPETIVETEPGLLDVLESIQQDPSISPIEPEIQDPMHPDSAMRKRLHKQEHDSKMLRMKIEPGPSSIQEYERNLISNPNSSYDWIQYMAYLISIGSTKEARALVQRALNTISYHLEDERFHMWSAWISFEWTNLLACRDREALDAFGFAFGEAVVRADSKRVHMMVWDLAMETLMQGDSKQRQVAQTQLEFLEKRLAKFKTSCKVWVKTWEMCSALKDHEKKHRVYSEALQILPKQKHVKFVQKLGLLEYQQNQPEYARNMFETLVCEHPKRLDLWFTYIQAEIKLVSATGMDSRLDSVRQLMERALSVDFSTKKIKSLFKLYFRFESKFGSEASVDRVTSMAKAYVQQLTRE